MKPVVGLCALILVVLVSHTVQDKRESPIPRGTDCTEIKKSSPLSKSGHYYIQPPGTATPFSVYCYMHPDGGWTVFQRRSGSALSFTQNWSKYKDGFGYLAGDHWLGLEQVYQLTKDHSKRWTLRVDLWDHEGNYAYALYTNFWVESSQNNYKLHVDRYFGNAGDGFRGLIGGIDQNGYGFSTIDRDNDGCSPCIFGDIAVSQCTRIDPGGWWYSKCGAAGLNGEYHHFNDHLGWSSGLHWHTWKGPVAYSLKKTRMMIMAV